MTSPPRDISIDLVDGGFYGGNPYPAFKWMRDHAPVFYDEANGVWGITRYGDIRAISRDAKTFSSKNGIRPDTGALPMMIDMDDPEHSRRRKLVSSGFTPKKIRDLQDHIATVCDLIIDRVCTVGTCDFVKDIAAPLPMILIGDMLGIAPQDRDDLLRWSDVMLSALGSSDPNAMLNAATAFNEYTAYIGKVIDERRVDGKQDDLTGTLVHAIVEGDYLDDASLVHETLLILIGGDETTRHVISGGYYELLTHPDQLSLLANNPSIMNSAIEECLRWVSPIKNMARSATRDVELHGQTIRQDQKLLLLYPSANRDERQFEDPDDFNIQRTPNDHIAFGFGPHFCMGNQLARLELRVMFSKLLSRLPDLRLVDPQEPQRRCANFVSGFESMPVEFTPTE